MSTLGIENIEHTNGTSALTVDTSGRINMPKVPAFAVRGYGTFSSSVSPSVNGVTIANGTDIIYNYDEVTINRGSAFSNSTGIYTVPVAGLYQVQAGYGYKTSTNYLSLHLFLTASDDTQNGHIATWGNNGYRHTGRQVAHIVEASVGQEFALGMSDSYSNPETHLFYLWFSAYMIG